MSEHQQILYSKESRVATVTLNRPEKLNAYSEVMVHEILTALADAHDDDQVRAVIFTGAGRGFCSGGGVSRDFQYPSRYRWHPLESMLEMRENMHQLILFLQRFDKPVIAAGNGPAAAGGLALALACDFRAKLGDTSLRISRGVNGTDTQYTRVLCKLSVLFVSISCLYAGVADNADVAGQDRLFESWIRAQIIYRGLPGIAVGVVSDQELVWTKGFGFADMDSSRPRRSCSCAMPASCDWTIRW